MRFWQLHSVLSLSLCILALCAGSCNDAAVGFNAPFGSSVKMTTVADAENVTGPLAALMNISVLNSKGEPGNGIQVQIVCGPTFTACTLYDKAEGESMVTLDLTRLQQISNPVVKKTDDRGLITIVVLAVPPADLGLTSYKPWVEADIGVASEIATWTLTAPAAAATTP